MGFLIPCPNCGLRDAYEFIFGGESKPSTTPRGDIKSLRHEIYFNKNVAGVHEEAWYHGACGKWLIVNRDTTSNQITQSRLRQRK